MGLYAIWWIFRKSAVTFVQFRATLATLSMLFLTMCLIYFETLPVGDSGNQKLCTIHLSKIAVPGTKSQIADRKIADKLYGKSYENFQSPGFPYNFPQNYRLQLKLAVSTRLDVNHNLYKKIRV
jgi:hypothetical protein